MKAPDKIYLPIVQGRTRKDIRYDATYFAPTEFAEENIEYIRKDALLEWAENEKKWREETFHGENYFASAQTALSALIDKLNSM